MERIKRPLTEAERRLVRWHLKHRSRVHQRHWLRVSMVGGAFFIALWSLTLVASTAPFLVISLFWLITGLLMTTWIGRDLWRPSAVEIRELEEALRDGYAMVTEVNCVRYASIEEQEDEGAALILELPRRRLTFLSGQENYPSQRFPASRMELIEVQTAGGIPVISARRCRGVGLKPERILPASVKRVMHWPGDGALVAGTLEDMEALLGLKAAG